MSVAAAGLALTAIGTYPFAGFIKEEALQTSGFAFNTAKATDDVEGMQSAIDAQTELLNAAPSIMAKIPFANVQKALKSYFDAAAVNLDNDIRYLERFEEFGVQAQVAKRDEEQQKQFERNTRNIKTNQEIAAARRNFDFEQMKGGK